MLLLEDEVVVQTVMQPQKRLLHNDHGSHKLYIIAVAIFFVGFIGRGLVDLFLPGISDFQTQFLVDNSWLMKPLGRGNASKEDENPTAVVAQEPAAPGKCREPQTFLIDNFGLRGPIVWDVLPKETQDEFTMNNSMVHSLLYLYNNGGWTSGEPVDHRIDKALEFVWTHDYVQSFIDKAKSRAPDTCSYGSAATRDFFAALDEHPVKGKSVLVIGSQIPWAEAMMYAGGAASITTVDFNPPRVEYPNFTESVHVKNLDANDRKFDVLVSFSSIEHDGLGRYGDPLNPNGDLERMKRTRNFMKPDSIFFLGVPNGQDALVYNAHRVYGPARFKLLIDGYELLNTYHDISLEAMFALKDTWEHQPVHVLKLKNDP